MCTCIYVRVYILCGSSLRKALNLLLAASLCPLSFVSLVPHGALAQMATKCVLVSSAAIPASMKIAQRAICE